MMRPELAARAAALAGERVPYVTAIVVRAARPASVRPGDSALVLGDGTIEGFVGGSCAESSVRLQALRSLETGEPMLLRILPGEDDAPAGEGTVTVQNPCLSGGSLEIFLEPHVPAPRLTVVGDTPIALALADLAGRVGFHAAPTAGADFDCDAGDAGVVVASHGRGEEPALERALMAGTPYVGLVASPRRGDAVREGLADRGVPADILTRLRTPAGLDIGARTPEEIAISILAEVVASRREHPAHPPAAGSAVDPVCGMTIAVAGAPSLEHDGRRVHFCSEHCLHAFEAEPARYAPAL